MTRARGGPGENPAPEHPAREHPTPDGPALTVLVVNYNGGPGLVRALEAHLAALPGDADLVVVDNCSADDSPELLRRFAAEHPRVRTVFNRDNRGYSAAVNQVLATSTAPLLAVLNMDVVVEPDWLAPLLALLAARPEVAAVNPLITEAGSGRVAAAGQAIHVTGLGFNRALGRRVDELPAEPFDVSGIQGGAFVVRRRALAAIGGMDEAGFLYHEDVHLSWTLRLAGWELACVPASRVHHDYFLSMYPEKFHLLERNRVALLLTHLRAGSLLLLAPLVLATEAMAWGYALLRGPRFLAAKARSYRWVAAARRRLRQRRRQVADLRRVPDRRLLARLHWRYEWSQFATLGRERGESRRQPPGGLRSRS